MNRAIPPTISRQPDESLYLVDSKLKLRLQEMEAKAGMELELWKNQEESKFLAALREKEKESLKLLADEWRRRDRERENITQKRLKEYKELEQKLRTALDACQVKEKKFLEADKMLEIREEKVKRENEQIKMAISQATDKYRVTLTEQLQNEKIIADNLRNQTREMEGKLVKLEQKLANREKEIFELKEKAVNQPAFKLEAELKLLEDQKVSLLYGWNF